MIKNVVFCLSVFLIMLVILRGCLTVHEYEQEQHSQYIETIK